MYECIACAGSYQISPRISVSPEIRPTAPSCAVVSCAVVEGEVCTTVKFYLFRFWKHFRLEETETISLFSVAKATLEIALSSTGVVMLNRRCGYVQKGVVMLRLVWLC